MQLIMQRYCKHQPLGDKDLDRFCLRYLFDNQICDDAITCFFFPLTIRFGFYYKWCILSLTFSLSLTSVLTTYLTSILLNYSVKIQVNVNVEVAKTLDVHTHLCNLEYFFFKMHNIKITTICHGTVCTATFRFSFFFFFCKIPRVPLNLRVQSSFKNHCTSHRFLSIMLPIINQVTQNSISITRLR